MLWPPNVDHETFLGQDLWDLLLRKDKTKLITGRSILSL
jgi:hypothetical protein